MSSDDLADLFGAAYTGVNSGTTEPITSWSIFSGATSIFSNNPVTKKPASSDVRLRVERTRKKSTSRLLSNSPTTVLVLPISIASSMT